MPSARRDSIQILATFLLHTHTHAWLSFQFISQNLHISIHSQVYNLSQFAESCSHIHTHLAFCTIIVINRTNFMLCFYPRTKKSGKSHILHFTYAYSLSSSRGRREKGERKKNEFEWSNRELKLHHKKSAWHCRRTTATCIHSSLSESTFTHDFDS